MLKDEIIEMAKKCGLVGMRSHADGIYIDALLDFAKLAAEAEREACAKLVEPDDKDKHDAIHGSHINWVIFKMLESKTYDIRTREKDD